MKHTHSKIWIHLVWTTKNRERILFKDSGQQVFKYLIEKAKEVNILFECLNVQPEHIHGLIDLPTNESIADFMKNIKGASSHFVNSNNIFPSHFEWQRGYGAYSVSASQIQVVKDYIKNQSEHHKTKTFSEEYEEWKRNYGLFDE